MMSILSLLRRQGLSLRFLLPVEVLPIAALLPSRFNEDEGVLSVLPPLGEDSHNKRA